MLQNLSYPLIDVWVMKNPRNILAMTCHICSHKLPDKLFASSSHSNVNSSGSSNFMYFFWYFSDSNVGSVYHCVNWAIFSQNLFRIRMQSTWFIMVLPVSYHSLLYIDHFAFYHIMFWLRCHEVYRTLLL